MNNFISRLFGFQIKRPEEEYKDTLPSFVPPHLDDAASLVSGAVGGSWGMYVDLDGNAKSDAELVMKYRDMAMTPECDKAIENIVNEAIVFTDENQVVEMILDKTGLSDNIKQIIQDEFYYILSLLKFSKEANELFRRWYIDGRLYFHAIIDETAPELGIMELRFIDPIHIRRIREKIVPKNINPIMAEQNFKQIRYHDYYIYSDKGFISGAVQGIKIAKDSIVYATSGIKDSSNKFVLSYLHKAIKPLNQLKYMEDATVIYRICLTGDSRVKTTNGYKYIKDITENDIVYSFNTNGIFETRVNHLINNGIQKVYSVKSKHFEIKGNESHPILVFDDTNNEVSYVDIKDIDTSKHYFVHEMPHEEENKNIIKLIDNTPKSSKLLNHEIFVNDPIKNKEKLIDNLSEKLNVKRTSVRNFLYGNQYLNSNDVNNILTELNYNKIAILDEKNEGNFKHKINVNYLDEEFARLFGFLIGDGSVSKNTIVFAEGIDNVQNEFYSSLIEKFFGNCKRYPCKGRKYTNYTCSNTLGSKLLYDLGFISGAHNKRIPEWVFQASKSIRLNFILGLIDADGHIKRTNTRWQAEIELCNKELIEDIKELWTGLGFASGHIRHSISESHTRKFGDRIKTLPKCESWSLYISNIKLTHFEKINSVTYIGEEEVYDIEVNNEKHNFIVNGVIVHNSRAPERRVFYVDVGNLPKMKAEQYVRDIMTKQKNRVVYDATTGEIRDDRKFQTMIEDYYIPRRDGNKGTEIDTLPAAQNLGEMRDVEYFQEKLYESLNVPVSRLSPETPFNLGRTTEITRDELQFYKFIAKLRNKFCLLLLNALEKQLILKRVMDSSEWDQLKDSILFRFNTDNHFAQLKELDILNLKMETLQVMDPYVGRYFSKLYVQKNVLNLTDDQIREMEIEIEADPNGNIPMLIQNQIMLAQMMPPEPTTNK
jgi:intein/homing endonuclease